MTLNAVMALTLCYFTEFASFWGALVRVRVQCCRHKKKFTFTISSPDEFLFCIPLTVGLMISYVTGVVSKVY